MMFGHKCSNPIPSSPCSYHSNRWSWHAPLIVCTIHSCVRKKPMKGWAGVMGRQWCQFRVGGWLRDNYTDTILCNHIGKCMCACKQETKAEEKNDIIRDRDKEERRGREGGRERGDGGVRRGWGLVLGLYCLVDKFIQFNLVTMAFEPLPAAKAGLC